MYKNSKKACIKYFSAVMVGPIYMNNLHMNISIYEENKEIYKGVIDLILEYSDYISIFDYKLKNISDEEYIKQLKGYKKYLNKITNKNVIMYLYSIIDDKLTEVIDEK